MAFTVTPTSGDGPYVLSAEIEGADLINGLYSMATVVNSVAVGSCPPRGSGPSLDRSIVDSLVAGNEVQLPTANVPSGSCRSFTLSIVRLSDNAIISSEIATVDNL